MRSQQECVFDSRFQGLLPTCLPFSQSEQSGGIHKAALDQGQCQATSANPARTGLRST